MGRPIYKNLTVQVLTAIVAGALLGHFKPEWGQALKPVSEGFLRLIRMVVGPIIFLTIVVGIASMGDLKKVGRVGWKALVYFEIVTTIALVIGLLVGHVVKPGVGITKNAASADIGDYVKQSQHQSFSEFVLHIIPDSIVGAFTGTDLLPILFVSIITGIAVTTIGGEDAPRIIASLERAMKVMFRIVSMVMLVAPIGAFGAMAFTVGKYGLAALVPLAKLMGCVYITLILFIFVVLGGICRAFGFSIWRFLVYIREELLLVLGTSSSESALPRLIERLEMMGCGRGVVGMVVPAGYSFNLDGTSVYLSMAIVFIAQAYGIELSVYQMVMVLGVLLLTSKGAAGVAGAGFVCLAATISTTKVVPLEGLALLLGIDRFLSEARALTNLIGNGVATLVISRVEGEFDPAKYREAMGLPEVESDLARR